MVLTIRRTALRGCRLLVGCCYIVAETWNNVVNPTHTVQGESPGHLCRYVFLFVSPKACVADY